MRAILPRYRHDQLMKLEIRLEVFFTISFIIFDIEPNFHTEKTQGYRHRHRALPTQTHLRAAPQGEERVDAEPLEFPETARLRPAHQVQEALGQLEGGRLEAQVSPGAVGEHEPEIHVDHVALGIEQDVPVMPATKRNETAEHDTR